MSEATHASFIIVQLLLLVVVVEFKSELMLWRRIARSKCLCDGVYNKNRILLARKEIPKIYAHFETRTFASLNFKKIDVSEIKFILNNVHCLMMCRSSLLLSIDHVVFVSTETINDEIFPYTKSK